MTTPHVGTISGRVVLRVVDFAARRGHDPGVLCRSVGLHLDKLKEPDSRVPYGVAEDLGERAAAAMDDENFGLHLAQGVGEAFTYDAGALMLMASSSVRVGLERMVRFQRYWGDGERTRLVPAQRGLAVRYALPGPPRPSRRHSDECALAEIVVGLRVLTASDVAPRAVRFRHPKPRDTSEHDALFRCAPVFGADHTEVELDDAILDLALPHANAAYCAIFEAQVERALASLPDGSGMTAEVRAAARATLAGGECTLAGTARILGTSARTMQRRLREPA